VPVSTGSDASIDTVAVAVAERYNRVSARSALPAEAAPAAGVDIHVYNASVVHRCVCLCVTRCGPLVRLCCAAAGAACTGSCEHGQCWAQHKRQPVSATAVAGATCLIASCNRDECDVLILRFAVYGKKGAHAASTSRDTFNTHGPGQM
jgi:hypothetical protein